MKKTALCWLLCLVMGLSACTLTGLEEQNNPETQTGIPVDRSPENTAETTISQETTQPDQDTVAGILASMTLEEKVGQLFVAAFRYDDTKKPMLSLSETAKNELEAYHVGGVILFAENIDTIPQTLQLIDTMQMTARIPLFVATDEEGGRVSRLNASGNMHATKLPTARAIGKTGKPEEAWKVGRVLGRELASLGFNMDFAPVADVDTNPKNPVIGDRSFGRLPEPVGRMVSEMTRGIQEQNVSAVLKHFPGHGDTASDTHTGAVILKHDRKRLDSIELIPFKEGIAAGVDGVMVAHIQLPAITGDSVPASLSRSVITGILREDLGYQGLVITDALDMGAISRYWSPAEAAVKAFEAGADILLMPASLKEAWEGIRSAVLDGRIPEARLNESVERILRTKEKRDILYGNGSSLDAEETLGCKEHQAVAAEIES